MSVIQVDDRQQTLGNDHLLRIVRLLGKMGVPTLMKRLEFGDVSFDINGPDDCPTPLGIEIKRVPDLLQCITSKRFAGYQLPGLYRTYKIRYLIVEGWVRAAEDNGLIEVMYQGRWVLHPSKLRYLDVLEWLTGLELRANIKVVMVGTTPETVAKIFSTFTYGSKSYTDHKSFDVFYEPEELASGITFEPIARRRRFAALMPGLGWEKSKGAAEVFPSIRAMALGDPQAPPMTQAEYDRAVAAWTTVEYGKKRKMRVGVKTAQEIIKAVCE